MHNFFCEIVRMIFTNKKSTLNSFAKQNFVDNFDSSSIYLN